jgi:hypothetical protein
MGDAAIAASPIFVILESLAVLVGARCEDVLTPEDVALHYCCDACARRREMDF